MLVVSGVSPMARGVMATSTAKKRKCDVLADVPPRVSATNKTAPTIAKKTRLGSPHSIISPGTEQIQNILGETVKARLGSSPHSLVSPKDPIATEKNANILRETVNENTSPRQKGDVLNQLNQETQALMTRAIADHSACAPTERVADHWPGIAMPSR